ncbi:MAG: hypothetical protein K6A68_08480 [Clostridiales bacterium]|nr:hypothetical protein [Clostridiales bacterium]
MCKKNEGYLARIRECADSLELNYTLEIVTDMEQIRQQGYENVCTIGYCPGCGKIKQFLKVQKKRPPTVPVLTANGELLFRDIPPTDEALCLKLKRFV